MITVLSGGVGAARMLAGIVQVVPPSDVVAIVNTGDDLVMHGLEISPDLDTITYTLAGEIDADRGWGLTGETWHAMQSLERYGGETWFGLGDRDIGTHLYRTSRKHQGDTLSDITADICRAWGLGLRLLPVTNDELRTRVTVAIDGEISFQEYFVQRHHSVAVSDVRFAGADLASAAPGVLEAIDTADTIVIAPSNPIVSIGPILAIDPIRQAVQSRRDSVVAVSPIIAGSALKGPADRLLTELGHESSVVGVARIYASLAATLVIDDADAHLAPDVEAEGMTCIVAPTIMSTPQRSAALALVVLAARSHGVTP